MLEDQLKQPATASRLLARKGRDLDAAVIGTRIKSSSSERGEYEDDCFLRGAAVDGEFDMMLNLPTDAA